MNPVCHAVQPPVAQPVQPLYRKHPMITKQRFSVLLLAAAAFTTMVGCAATSKQESTGQYVDDTVITTRVKAAIFQEASLKSAEINVETFKGAVQLSGFVNSQADINRAVQVTQSVPGVKSIKNDMRMK
jgi:osmotically-inducible protein OsmY